MYASNNAESRLGANISTTFTRHKPWKTEAQMSEDIEVLPPSKKEVAPNFRTLLADIGILTILYATVCGFLLRTDFAVAITVAVSICILLAVWIMRRGLKKLAWVAMILAVFFGFTFVAGRFSNLWAAAISANSSLGAYGEGVFEGVFYGRDMEYLALGSGSRLIWLATLSAICILVAEWFHRIASRPVQTTVAYPQANVGRGQELLKQVGRTENGEPLFVSVGGTSRGDAKPYGSRTNVLAILTLVFGLLGGIIAIPLGHIALNQIKKTGDSGLGITLAGLICGYVWLVLLVTYFIFIVMLLS